MLGGDVPLTVTAGPEGVVAKLQGADIVLLSANNPTMHFSLFVSPEIKKAEDLRGKRAGVSRFGSASDFSIRYIFRSLGLVGERRYDCSDWRQSQAAGGAENERDSGYRFYVTEHRAREKSRISVDG